MFQRRVPVAGVLCLSLLAAACARVADDGLTAAAEAEAASPPTVELAGGLDVDPPASVMDAAVDAALADAAAVAANRPPVVLVVSNQPVPNPGDPAPSGAPLRIAMLPVPNPETPSAPALMGAPEAAPAPHLELAAAHKPRPVGALRDAPPAPRPTQVAAVARKPAPPSLAPAPAAATPSPAPAPAPAVMTLAEGPAEPATPVQALLPVVDTAAPPPAEEVAPPPRVAAGVTPVAAQAPVSPLLWLPGAGLLILAAVFAAVRLARRDRGDPIRA